MPDAQHEIRRFTTRVRRAQLLGAAADALLVWALAVAGTIVALRLLGLWLAPGWWLAPVVLVPPAAWGVWRLRRSGFGRGVSAQHLDRRLGLEGLLVASLERDSGAWRDRLEDGLERAAAALPRLRGRRLLARVAPAGLAIGVLFLLSAPVSPTRTTNPLAAEALEDFRRKLERVDREGILREESREELERRLARAEKDLRDGKKVSWSDLDGMDARLGHERDLRASELARMREAFAEMAGRDSTASMDSADGRGAAASEEMKALMRDAAAAGLLDGLPEGLREKLGAAGSGDSGEVAGEPLDAETMRQLAAALARAADGELARLVDARLVEGLELEDLAELLGEAALADLDGKPCAVCEGQGDAACPGCAGEGTFRAAGDTGDGRPGRGGVTRGRADAALTRSGSTEGATDAFEAKKLPPGMPRPTGFTRLGVRRTAPETGPVRDGTAGSAGDAGSGEAAWRRRLAPRHRDVVRRFFSDD